MQRGDRSGRLPRHHLHFLEHFLLLGKRPPEKNHADPYPLTLLKYRFVQEMMLQQDLQERRWRKVKTIMVHK
ncbi:hypothetical protein VTK73DRAFT_876 [Phialemonium thermophilum]|uniref:Uncharacterized protein n=1 Tax=Phialemonium thermophilum TaxID=223376 RepID=A0ABR3Y374_9PEZI